MYSRKSAGTRMEVWKIPSLTGYSCEDLPLEPLEAADYWEKKKYSQISDLKFHKI